MKDHVDQRPKITVSEQFMADVVPMIRRQFCPHWDDKNWNMHLWLIQRTVTYPAAWLNKKGLFVTAKRYHELLLDLLQEIKQKGGEMKFPPGYLLHCVQRHMAFNADRYNNEGKVTRDVIGRVLAQAKTGEAREDELVRTLAEASRLIRKPTRKRVAAVAVAQGELL